MVFLSSFFFLPFCHLGKVANRFSFFIVYFFLSLSLTNFWTLCFWRNKDVRVYFLRYRVCLFPMLCFDNWLPMLCFDNWQPSRCFLSWQHSVWNVIQNYNQSFRCPWYHLQKSRVFFVAMFSDYVPNFLTDTSVRELCIMVKAKPMEYDITLWHS